MLVLPSVTVPARCKRSTTVASNGLRSFPASSSRRWCASRACTKMSLCAIGMPVSGGRRFAAARRRLSPARRQLVSSVMNAFRPLRGVARGRATCCASSAATIFRTPRTWTDPASSACVDDACRARAMAVTRSPSARDTGRPATAGAVRWYASRSIGLGDRVVAQAQRTGPADCASGCAAARRRSCRPRCICSTSREESR